MAQTTTRCGRCGSCVVGEDARLELDWLGGLTLMLGICEVPCSAREYGLERRYEPWLLVLACIFVGPFRFSLRRGSYISAAAPCPNSFTIWRIISVA